MNAFVLVLLSLVVAMCVAASLPVDAHLLSFLQFVALECYQPIGVGAGILASLHLCKSILFAA